MAGHSKWANIKHRKGAQDAKRGKLFTKLIREITVAAKLGGPDADANPRLRAAVDKALAANMPKDTVSRAIKRGAGAQEGENFEEVRYEGYGPNGVAVMVDCLTDNNNRTVSEVRHAFSKCGGNLGTDGSVAYLFSMEAAIEAGAEDVVTNDDGSIDIITTPEEFTRVRDAMKAAGLPPAEAEITMKPATSVDLELGDAEKVVRLMDMLEDLDDVQNVYSNADFSQEVLQQLA
jgi:transcriptional/translational regulatory protein YebC/TACO1